jgi:hypothetical protein
MWVKKCLQVAVVPMLKEAVLKSMAQIMKVDIADGTKRLILWSNSACCGQTEVLTAEERTTARGSSPKT